MGLLTGHSELLRLIRGPAPELAQALTPLADRQRRAARRVVDCGHRAVRVEEGDQVVGILARDGYRRVGALVLREQVPGRRRPDRVGSALRRVEAVADRAVRL